jgi:RHS repeat-associated protein
MTRVGSGVDVTAKHATERYCRARYYHPGLQRFISEDPIGFAGGDISLYGYVGNSPTNLIDPTGQFILLPPVVIVGGAVALGVALTAVLTSGGDTSPVLTGRASHDEADDKPYERIAFGQRRISERFSDNVTLYARAASIMVGAQPRLEVTRFNGQLAAINNRTLAAYGLAGVRPTNLKPSPFETLPSHVQARFYEPGVPSFVIPVTLGDVVLFYVEAPR